jgi:hypothetical protein
VNARRRFGLFAGAFIWNACAFTMDTRGFVLDKTGTPRSVTATATGQCQRASGAEHEESDRENAGEALPDESTRSRRSRAAGRAHGPQLHSVER